MAGPLTTPRTLVVRPTDSRRQAASARLQSCPVDVKTDRCESRRNRGQVEPSQIAGFSCDPAWGAIDMSDMLGQTTQPSIYWLTHVLIAGKLEPLIDGIGKNRAIVAIPGAANGSALGSRSRVPGRQTAFSLCRAVARHRLRDCSGQVSRRLSISLNSGNNVARWGARRWLRLGHQPRCATAQSPFSGSGQPMSQWCP
jgi:hypothetical protein